MWFRRQFTIFSHDKLCRFLYRGTHQGKAMAASSPVYAELKEEELSSSSLLSEGEDGITYHVEPKPTWSTRRWIAILFTSLVVTNTVNTIVMSKTVLSHQKPCRRTLWEPPNGIVPYFSNISLELEPVRRYAPFYDRTDSIYRKHESPETEVAWRKLTQLDSGFMLLPKEQGAQAGIDPKRHVYWNEPGKGLVGYPVRLEATHELHCLNLIRRYSYFHYNYTLQYDHEKMKDEPFHYGRLHLDHCIEYLRQRLMCIADMSLLPYIWLGDDGDMVSDMTGVYTCRNYESLRSFVEKNGEAADGRVKPKPGELVLYDYV